MKRLITLLSIASVLVSCSSKVIPIKGTYPATPYEVKSSKTFDETWDKLIDLFAQKGLAIRIIDRSSGLITSDKTSIPATYEKDKTGDLEDQTAFIVLQQIYLPSVRTVTPLTGIKSVKEGKIYRKMANDAIGEWNVRIKKDGTGSLINVNLVNVGYQETDAKGFSRTTSFNSSQYKSTGVFESMIADLIK